VRFGVLSKERCRDPAKRTGNEYMYQELANGNIEDLKALHRRRFLTSCPHCVKTTALTTRVRLHTSNSCIVGVRRRVVARRSREGFS